MKILSEYREAIKSAGKIKKAYFTTFNISAQFVEKYIVPPLLDPDKEFCKDWYDYIDLDKELMNSKTDIKFFYDFNMYDESQDEKKTMVTFYPIKQECGVFHPKVIYIEGDKASFLIVGSGNLTKNGWSENIEAFHSVEVFKNTEISNKVNTFWQQVFGLADNKKYRIDKMFIDPIKLNKEGIIQPDFLFSNFYQDKSLFLESILNNSKFLQIWSPYFSNDINEIMKKEINDKPIYIIPDFTSEDKIRIDDKETLEKLQVNENIHIYKDIKNERMNHSKVWITNNKIAIGSYNLTKQALYGNNFEAALILNNIDTKKLNVKDNNEYEKREASSLQEIERNKIEDDNEKNGFSMLFTVFADWNKSKITINCPSKDKANIQRLKIFFHKSYKINGDEIELNNIETAEIFDYLITNKNYRIQDNDDNILFEGLVIEENASEKNRKIIKVESLDEMFTFEEKIISNLSDRETIERIYKYRDKNHRQKVKNNIDYFNIFTFFNKKLEEAKKIIKEENSLKSIENFCYRDSTSLRNIKNILEAEKQQLNNKNLRLYLMIDEFNNIVIIFNNEQIKKDLEIDNIKEDIGLTYLDEKFIGEFNNDK